MFGMEHVIKQRKTEAEYLQKSCEWQELLGCGNLDVGGHLKLSEPININPHYKFKNCLFSITSLKYKC